MTNLGLTRNSCEGTQTRLLDMIREMGVALNKDHRKCVLENAKAVFF